ncbi:unnamed protein product [Caenorhabditis sp. 36 PRJEB53466]|nr:unnamed protein product [Caenorhabditis sp. 36 PRJEB53466]
MVPAACDTAYNISFHAVYRISQFYQVFVLILAVFPLIYFIGSKLFRSNFHGNLKWTLIGYFCSVLVFTLAYIIFATIQLVVPMVSTEKCDLIISRGQYRIGNIVGSLLMTLPTFFPISITIERFLATRHAKNYEKTPVILGPVLTVFVILLDTFLIFLIYKDEEFPEGSISFLFFPATTAPKAYQLTFHPIYRTSQYYQLTILSASICPLLYFIASKLWKSSFHGNLKWLLIGYFTSILIFSLVFAVETALQILIPLLSTSPCDLIISEAYYTLGNALFSLTMTMSTFFPISITCERFVAAKNATSYERTTVILGPALTVLVILLDSSIIFQIYTGGNVTFSQGSISFIFFTDVIASRMYTFFWTMLCVNLVNLLLTSLLVRQNSRLKREGHVSLGTKYQLEEVYLSTKFAASVIFLHTLFFGGYICIAMLARYFGDQVITDPVDLTAIRAGLMTMIATYNFIIGTVAVYLYKRIRTKKSVQIAGTIQMKSTGNAGARNYDLAIFSIWNNSSVNSTL